MPQNRIRFGVLTLLGSCMLILAAAEKLTGKRECKKAAIEEGALKNAGLWMFISFFLFALTKRINYGYLGFADIKILELPESLYHLGDFGNFLGFTTNSFYSTDYFSLFPWLFLFLTGFFLQKWFMEKEWMDGLWKLPSLGKWWSFMGRHSLIIYLLHQPVIYGVLSLIL